MEIGIKNFDLCDIDNEPIRVDYNTISNDDKNTSLIKEKCQFSFYSKSRHSIQRFRNLPRRKKSYQYDENRRPQQFPA